ncbi:MAG: DM13 domain-containing protein [Rhizobiaceae bacterium]
MTKKNSVAFAGSSIRHVMAGLTVVACAAIFIFAPAASASPLGKGKFRGATGHVTSGSVSVREQAGRYVIELASNFSLDGAPDPYVALGKGSGLVSGGLIAVLKSNTGKQRYAVKITPALQGATEVIIWCKKFSVPIGVAPIR